MKFEPFIELAESHEADNERATCQHPTRKIFHWSKTTNKLMSDSWFVRMVGRGPWGLVNDVNFASLQNFGRVKEFKSTLGTSKKKRVLLVGPI